MRRKFEKSSICSNTKSDTTEYNLKVDNIESITAGQAKITFLRLSACSKTELDCQPMILVFNTNGDLVKILKTEDTEHIKVSAISDKHILEATKSSDIKPYYQNLNFAEVQKNFYDFNSQTLSRCRSTQSWEQMVAINESPISAIYIHMGLKSLKNKNTMFRLDTSNGSVTITENKDSLTIFNMEIPYFVINAKDLHGNILQDNALIHLYNQNEECTRTYKFLNIPYSEFNSSSDEQASHLVDLAFQRENRDNEAIDPIFPSIRSAENYLRSAVENVKADKKLFQKL